VVIGASIGIYFLVLSSHQTQDTIGYIKNEIGNFSVVTNVLEAQVSHLNSLNVTNFEVPDALRSLFNVTDYITAFLETDKVRNTFAYDWVIIIAFVVLMLLAIGASVTAFFNVRVIYVILGYIFFASFLILSVAAIATVSMGAFASNFCASGIDDNVRTIISSFDMTNDTCYEQVVKKFIFCEEFNFNGTCDPFIFAHVEINEAVDRINEQIKNNNTDPKLQDALRDLLAMNGTVNTLSNCTGFHHFYNTLSTRVCFGPIASLVNLSTSLELMALTIFLFLLTALYTWHRIYRPSNTQGAYDYESIMSHNIPRRNELSPSETKDMDCSTGCFLHVLLIILFWGLFTFGAFTVLSFGALETQVSRHHQ
jgi:hypothetical protein